MNKSLTEPQKSWLLIALMWVALLVLSVLRPLAIPDEGRYGEIGRWMLITGDWLTPRLNGLPFFHKPPLLHWLQASSLAVFGVNEFALRLVPALHAGLMISTLYVAARTVATEQIARRAAVMLGTSLTFLIGGQYINHDMLVATWITMAIGCFAFAFAHGERPHAMLARLGFAACALGMLSKGLIGIALPGLVLLVWLIWTRQLRKILYLPWLSGLALFSLIAVPWFALAQHKYSGFLDYMFLHHQVNRYTAETFNNPQPVWFFPLIICLLLFPWALFALAQIRLPRIAKAAAAVARPTLARPWLSLCWIWVVCITAFFSVPNSKLVGYILPVIPAVALLAAVGWEQVLGARPWAKKVFVALCVMNVAIASTIVLNVADVTAAKRTEDLAQTLACAASPGDTVYAMGLYPYDLPFYIQSTKPMVVLQDWPQRRTRAGDSWERELFEGADFDPQAGQVLQTLDVLVPAGQKPGNWLVTKGGEFPGWTVVKKGAGWSLYRSGAGSSAPEGPVTAEQKGLPGCKNQPHQ